MVIGRKRNNMEIKKSSLKFVGIGLLIVIVVVFLGMKMNEKDASVLVDTDGGNTKVLIETSEGSFTIELYSEQMPITAGNFEKLVKEGYYDGIIFHRVIKDFMIQGGDPTGTGSGGPGYTIKDEFVEGLSNERGTLSMANSGPNSGGSQFFINLVNNEFLDFDKQPLSSKHPVFGKVVEGMEVIDKIGSVQTAAGDRPVKEVKIISAKVI